MDKCDGSTISPVWSPRVTGYKLGVYRHAASAEEGGYTTAYLYRERKQRNGRINNPAVISTLQITLKRFTNHIRLKIKNKMLLRYV